MATADGVFDDEERRAFERIVMRILHKTSVLLDLSDLGFDLALYFAPLAREAAALTLPPTNTQSGFSSRNGRNSATLSP